MYSENLHNYSKSLNVYCKTNIKNCEKNHSKMVEVNDELQTNLDKDKTPPDHHARRPMNAFLIFCKRHRGIVREKYPNLENRSITKILGDWWANLEKDEKISYTNLAKQYKDAFFSANPNFKWYKLPAPPLRTLTTRPSNIEQPLLLSNCSDNFNIFQGEYFENLSQEKQFNYTKELLNNNDHEQFDVKCKNFLIKSNSIDVNRTTSTNVALFKLADETQMGELNKLIINHNSKMKIGNNNIGEGNETASESQIDGINIEQLVFQKELNETSAFLPKTMSSCRTEPFTNMRIHAAKMQSESIKNNKNKLTAYKRKVYIKNDDGFDLQHLINLQLSSKTSSAQLSEKPVDSVENVDEFQKSLMENEYRYEFKDNFKKSSRSCKGKRYLEFMNTAKTNSVHKKIKINKSMVGLPHTGYCKTLQTLSINSSTDQNLKTQGIQSSIKEKDIDENLHCLNNLDIAGKLFDASDFDLEDKIKALPALSLEKYLSKKRETKKKKKINGKGRAISYKKTSPTIQEVKEHIQSSMVGSQKRKARKESITRRDILSLGLQNDQDSGTIQFEPQSPITNTTEGTSDLFILATLAEMATAKQEQL